MPRVIKAGQTRLLNSLSSEARIAEPEPPEALPPPPSQEEEKEQAAPLDADVKQAYEELINTAQEEVSLMLQDARSEATAIYQKAEEKIEDMRRRVYDETVRQAMEDAAKEVDDILNRAQKDAEALVRQATVQRDKALSEMEPKILRLAIDIAQKILGIELEQNNAAYLSMLNTALAQVKAERQVTLRVNPSEYVRFFKSRDVTMHTTNGSIEATIISDPNVGYGGCLIETEGGTVDAGAEAQLEQIARNLSV